MNKPKRITLPLTRRDVNSLRVGKFVLLSGRIVTGRDRIHNFLFHKKLSGKQLPVNLKGSILYHCGPVVKKTGGQYRIIAGGPTTSIRLEMYEHKIIINYGLRGIMGKGGMGEKTLNALKKAGCVYFHAVGGAAVSLAEKVKHVVDVWKLEEFGPTEAMWILDVEDFPAVVTMDCHGKSLHTDIAKEAETKFRKLVFRN